MKEQAVIEAAREFVRAEESEAAAARHADPIARRSAMERRAIAFAKLKEALAAYDASPTASKRSMESSEPPAGSGRR